MNISSELIKQVREITGAGMNDVKKALDEAAGVAEKAVEILRKQGQKIAAKKAERTVKEGAIALAREGQNLSMVALLCETDFVARNEDFLKVAADFAKKLLSLGKEGFESWALKEIQDNLIIKIGENIQLGQFEVINGAVLGDYLHSNKKIATAVVLDGGNEDLAKEVAMQVAAMNPKYLSPEEVPQEEVAKEKEIYREQLKNEGKPEAMFEKIIEGKLQKFYTEVCLIKQPYIKDDKISVEKMLGEAKTVRFVRIAL